MLRNQKIILVLVLVFIGISGLYARNVSVINFKNWEKATKAGAIPRSKYKQFNEIGFCFKIIIEVMKTVISLVQLIALMIYYQSNTLQLF